MMALYDKICYAPILLWLFLLLLFGGGKKSLPQTSTDPSQKKIDEKKFSLQKSAQHNLLTRKCTLKPQ